MKKLALIGLATLTIAGCTNSSIYSGDVYTADQAKAAQSVSYGTVISARPVTIQADDSSLGTISGAALGGVLGNAMGGGRGRNITTAVGAVAGGLIGNKVQNQAGQIASVQIEIKTDSGQTIVVVQKQDKNVIFQPGQRVRMVGGGRNVNVTPM